MLRGYRGKGDDMANEEQLAILKQGVDAWNKWRRQYPDVDSDLSEEDLREANLSKANLSGTRLQGICLSGANLTGANLGRANLFLANLSGADLSGADLSQAELDMANLSKANLSMAHLIRAHLYRADLSEADLSRADLGGADLGVAGLREINLSGARLSDTIFASNDLSMVKGLTEVRHESPSTIGIDTIYKSKGNIPEVFLRGCGVPDDMIEFVRAIRGKPIQFYSCFISYSTQDQDFADRLYADLQSNGVRCWFAPHDMKIGDEIRDRIEHEIRVYDKLLLVLSERSIASDWVESEVEAALEKERAQKRPVLFPLRIDDAVMTTDKGWAAKFRRARHIGDMRQWKDHDNYKAGFDRLLRDLKAEPVEG